MFRRELVDYLNNLLDVSGYTDYCPNGLQVEGRDEIKNVVMAVSASVELFEKAIAMGADTVIVHHGLIWDFERPLYTGGYRQRVKLLLENNINLLAYHLPLDAHLTFGNAARIAVELGYEKIEPFAEYKGRTVGVVAFVEPASYRLIETKIKQVINPEILFFPYGPENVMRIGIVTGGAQKDIKQAILANLDMYITGEASEFVMHLAKEERIHFVAAGHYATERFGIKALGDHLVEKFGLKVHFIDIPNPV